jgi:7,8-didemethyl-8-hydroxy-5-deazariboflavin synthase CofG subunit
MREPESMNVSQGCYACSEKEEVRQWAQLSSESILELLEDRLSWQERLSAKPVTFSRNVFIPVTNLCRNNCAYCGFVSREENQAYLLCPDEVMEILSKASASGTTEALFALGERPERVSPWVHVSLEKWGYSGIVDYLRDLGEKALSLGLFPHTNAGVLNQEEIRILRTVNVSMGLMLESSSFRLCDIDGPHYYSPGKNPYLRRRMLEDAGRLSLPFSTGILIGIGETVMERVTSLWDIRILTERYGHIQEVIIQNFRRHPLSPMKDAPEPDSDALISTVALARLILGPEANIQVAPNLNSHEIVNLLEAGANDLGGVSSMTEDYINPEYPWPNVSILRKAAQEAGTCLKERLAIYPEFIGREGFIDRTLLPLVLDRVDKNGFVKE